ncbi:MAG: chloride channel protein [Gammaproteobacteria bacterium]|nr:chloride channel protein [Gammaproteobacteria bacterium]
MGAGVLKEIREAWSAWLDESRIRLSRPDALLPLAALGLLTGLLAGGVIVLFRLFVEGVQDGILPGEGPENFEALPGWARVLLPVLAALLLAATFRWFAKGVHMLGVARVMERMAYHQGDCTWRAFLLQFFGAALAIIGGHSVGREGPHIFLGAASGSLLGQHLSLPHNVVRALVGCGTAAGIAASFNTPLAGVVFALEVVMMEYSVASFIPVILAAVSATTLSRVVLGSQSAFAWPDMHMGPLHELAIVLVLGIAAGVASALFIQAVKLVAHHSRELPIWWRMPLAGLLVGAIGWHIPEVMGIGYDSVDVAARGSYAIAMLGLLMAGKLLATSLCIGLGVPGGVIGPALFIGTMLGALVAELAALTPFGLEGHVGFFALLGMGAMMSGSLQAPLAALTAMLELTDNPEIILPGMLAVVAAGITSKEVFGKDSLFVTMLQANGLDYTASPVFQALRRIGVAGVMNRSFSRVHQHVSREKARELLDQAPAYLLIDAEHSQSVLMPAVELAKFIETPGNDAREKDAEDIDLLSIPAERYDIEAIDLQANLQEAWMAFEKGSAEALLVRRMTAPGIYRIYGILTRDTVERSYRA